MDSTNALQSETSVAGPLAHLKVLDLTRVLAGPWCTQTLGDLGAEVIKIERPGTGDDTRAWGPAWLKDHAGRDTTDSAYFSSCNRNKRSVTVNLATPEGQEIVQRLAAQCDVLVENYKRGDLARYGLDYATLAPLNPRLIYCSITAYGQDGPYADRPGYDLLCQAEGGLMAINGHADPPEGPGGGPVKVVIAVTDILAGLNATIAILAALEARHRTGRGQHIDIALLDSVVQFGANQIANFFITGEQPKRVGNAHVNLAPYQSFRVADGHMIVGAGNDAQWRRLCAAMEVPELADDPRFREMKDRNAHRLALVEAMEAVLIQRTMAEWSERFLAAGVPHAPINTYAQVFAHPQVRHRGLRVDLVRPAEQGGGQVATVASPLRFSETPVSYRLAPPALGADTERVLGQWLGLSAEECARLRQRGVL
ncbi:MAG: CoA transferase [Casimicrobiaceae bacterium]|nr:CoA transferase [Casimicrobiaceae bacterium]MCX8098923.1 CoA transferase [Casimicrobiaceae bacterium]MDW8312621.1 CaiB/BaiF CoA-transferase family protein [Burkholderiales bacterium]